jgi:ribosome-binding protein aMBF1 (putative translation factor)
MQVEHVEKKTGVDIKDTEEYFRAIDMMYETKGYDNKDLVLARKKKGWSQYRLGVHLSVSKQFVGIMEKGRKPLTDNALAFVETMGIEKHELCYSESKKVDDLPLKTKGLQRAKTGGSDIQRVDNWDFKKNPIKWDDLL